MSKKPERIPVPEFMSVLLWGAPGAGKTTLASSLAAHPSVRRFLIIDVEGGWVSVPPALRDKMVVRTVTTKKAVDAVYWELARREGDMAEVDLVILDSGTELQQEELSEAAPNDSITLAQYGDNTTGLRRQIRWLRRLPVHFVITAFHKEVKNKLGTTVAVQPYFTDRLATSIAGYCGFVWYTYQQDGRHWLLTNDQRGLYKCKTRGHVFSRVLPSVVSLSDPMDPKSEGHSLASLYDMYLKAEGGSWTDPGSKQPEVDLPTGGELPPAADAEEGSVSIE